MNHSRAAAFHVLSRWDSSPEHVYVDALLAERLKKVPLSDKDASLARVLTLGVLQNQSLLDHWIDEWRRGNVSKKVRILLRLGLYQILFLRIPDHAAVNETVSLAKGARERNFINAILRRATRERDELLSARDQLPLHLQYSLPAFLVEKWSDRYGATAAKQLCDLINEPAPLFLRMNGLKPDALSRLPEDATPFPPDSRFFRVPSPPLEFLQNGYGYIQDPSTTTACDLLSPQPGDKVLDACAAPGGKTCLLAELMKGEGTIIACDSSETRLETLRDNINRLGVTNAATCQLNWADVSKSEIRQSFPHRFDKILLDAPCSNTGVMRRRVDVRWRISPATIKAMTQLQALLLDRVLMLLNPGGTLVYSTCSIESEENEQMVAATIARHSDLSLVKEESLIPTVDGSDGAYAALIKKR
jgi:16S rRNA (cytosine967-C5)-methyltransferase